jgi:uncharacterized integral membrane protein
MAKSTSLTGTYEALPKIVKVLLQIFLGALIALLVTFVSLIPLFKLLGKERSNAR